MVNIDINDTQAYNYTDLDGKSICPQKSQLLKDLKASVKNKVKQHYYHEFYINWERNAIDCEEFKQHSDYLANFNAFVVTRVRKLIDRFTKHRPTLPKRICNHDTVKVLQLESDFLANVTQYRNLTYEQKFTDGNLGKSLSSKLENTCWLIEEEIDSGKSALLASIYYEYYKDSIVLGQFINEHFRPSPAALKRNFELLLGWKLKENYRLDIQSLLIKASEKSKNVILLIDNLHLVSSQTDSNHDFEWIFQKLPSSVHIVCSISPNALNLNEEQLGEDLLGLIIQTITASAVGITEVEILDVLSINNDAVLLAVPANELSNLLRFPFSVWLYARKYLKPLFSTYHFKGRELWKWRNEDVRKSLKSLYFKTAESFKNTHKCLADYFSNKWINHKPLVVPERSIQIIEPYSCCRYLTPHPLLYSEYLYNYRRITELGQHFLHSVDIETVKCNIYFNLESLISLIQALGVHFLLEEIDLVLRHFFDTELHVLRDTIIACHKILEEDTLQLPVEIIGRLRNIEFGKDFPNISDLMLQCVQWCDSNTKPLLVPLSSWLPDPRQKTLITLNIPSTKAIITGETQFLTISTKENIIKMYHIASKQLIRSSFPLKSSVIFLLDCKDDRIAVSTADGSVIIWNLINGKFDGFLKQSSPIRANVLANVGDNLLLGNSDGSMDSFNLNTLEVVDKLKHHSDAITGLRVSKDGEYTVCTSRDKTVKCLSSDNLAVIMEISDENLNQPIILMSISSNNLFLVLYLEDGTVQIRSLVTGTFIHNLQNPLPKLTSLAVCSEGIFLSCATENHMVHLFNIRSTELLESNKVESRVHTTFLFPNDFVLMNAGADSIEFSTLLKRENAQTEKDRHRNVVNCVTVSRDGKMAVSGSKDTTLRVWSVDSGSLTDILEGHSGQVTCVAIANENAFIASGSADRTVKIWSIVLAEVVTNYEQHNSTVTCVNVLADNMRILSAEEEGKALLWNAEDGSTLLSCSCHTNLLAVSPISKLVFAGDGGCTAKLWLLNTGDVVGTLTHTDKITCVGFSPDNEYIVTGSMDNSLKIWLASSAKLTQVLVEHETHVTAVSVCSKTVVSGDKDGLVLLWDIEFGNVKQRMMGHTASIERVLTASDSSIIFTTDFAGEIRVWMSKTAKLLARIDLHYPIENIVISVSASHLVARITNSIHVPLLCLHNSPAKVLPRAAIELGSTNSLHVNPDMLQNQISGLNLSREVSTEIENNDEKLPLPFKWHQKRELSEFPVPSTILAERQVKSDIYYDEEEPGSSSGGLGSTTSTTIAPLQKVVAAQQQHKVQKSLPREKKENNKKKKEKKSSICCTL
ncbi:DgyrCDS9688 [Dimorphilus gyrociliatus]|uniref:DgyrCDS9688 n=1 Tax=Dimorphilus gyrociliatus TaxID=2664684 RepID=A0A7I8VZW8_9ANNE|nr:DgyrCDS9688 [Dimorphilus gyrociliatus]